MVLSFFFPIFFFHFWRRIPAIMLSALFRPRSLRDQTSDRDSYAQTSRTRAKSTCATSEPRAGRGKAKLSASVRRVPNTTNPCAAPTAKRTATSASSSTGPANEIKSSKYRTKGPVVSVTRIIANRRETRVEKNQYVYRTLFFFFFFQTIVRK